MMLVGKVCSTVCSKPVPAAATPGFAPGCQRDTHARLNQIGRAQSDHQSQRRDDFEIQDRLPADPAHGLHAAGARDPDHQGRKQQRSDDGFDQPEKDGPQQAEFLRGSGKRRAEGDARDQRDQDPDRQGRSLHRSPFISRPT